MKLSLEHLSKSYGNLTIFSDYSLDFDGPGIYCIMAPSGTGKTTLFRLILGLEQPDAGSICITGGAFEDSPRFSAVFQEDRLISHLTPVENLRLVLRNARDRETLQRELKKLLPAESLNRPVSTLSGGMKRRLAFLRAMLSPSDLVLMDEPFTGLDEKTKELVIRYLLCHREERLFLIATHNREDIKKMGATLVELP